MEKIIEVENLSYSVNKNKKILDNINLSLEKGTFLAVLGENGAGKTTLLDLLMGFRKPNSGEIQVMGYEPYFDHWQQRKKITYLSEKVDIPGDWTIKEFLEFNSFFYETYSIDLEKELSVEFGIDENNRIGNMSAGEIRRVQIIAGLAIQPEIIIIDEISAVLDIIGRRKFMKILSTMNKERETTIIFATNILEDLVNYISHIFLLKKGRPIAYEKLENFMGNKNRNSFSQLVADMLEEL